MSPILLRRRLRPSVSDAHASHAHLRRGTSRKVFPPLRDGPSATQSQLEVGSVQLLCQLLNAWAPSPSPARPVNGQHGHQRWPGP